MSLTVVSVAMSRSACKWGGEGGISNLLDLVGLDARVYADEHAIPRAHGVCEIAEEPGGLIAVEVAWDSGGQTLS